MTSTAEIHTVLDSIKRPPVTLRPPPLLWTVLNKLTGLKSRHYKPVMARLPRLHLGSVRGIVWTMQMQAVQCPKEDSTGFPVSAGRWLELLFLNGEIERLAVERDVVFEDGVTETHKPHLRQAVTSAFCKS